MTRSRHGAPGAATLLLLASLATGAAPAAARGATRVGVPSCDEYVRIYRCMVSRLPTAAQGSAAKAVERMVTAWRDVLRQGGRTARENLAKGCARAVTAVRSGLAKSPKFAACVGGAPLPADALSLPHCSTYARLYRCYLDKLPPKAAAPARRAYERMVAGWNRTLGRAKNTPKAQAAADRGCQRAVADFHRAFRKNPIAQQCISPPAAPPAKGAPPAAPPPAKGAAPGPASGPIGVASCDLILTRYRCFMSNLPAGARSSAQRAYLQLDRALRSAAANARAKGRIEEAEKACATVDQQLQRTFAQNQFGKTCVGAQVAAPPPNTPTPSTDPAEIAPERRGIQGVPACAAYVKMTRCFVSFLPGEAQGYAAKSLQDSVARWTGLLAKGQRDAVVRECTQALARSRGIIANDPTSASCARLQ